MYALVQPKIDPLGGNADEGDRGFGNLVRRPNERQDGSVMVRILLSVKQCHLRHRGDRIGQRKERGLVSPFADVRDTLDQSIHEIPPSLSTLLRPMLAQPVPDKRDVKTVS
jgi:hypothetical protein